MKRLRDDLHATDDRARLMARLVRAVPPLAPDAQRQRRVRLKMGSPRRRPGFFLHRPAIALTVLLAGMAGASAMVGGGWTYARQHISWLSLPPRTTPTPAPHAAPTRKHVAAKPAPVVEPVVEAPLQVLVPEDQPPPETAPVVVDGHDRRIEPKRRVSAPRRPLVSEALPAPTDIPAGPGAELMLGAMQARRAGDMAKAERLLNEYRTRYPKGALQEEALVLSLEAAVRRGDPAADELARTYLRRFPNGRFRSRVQEALDSTAR